MPTLQEVVAKIAAIDLAVAEVKKDVLALNGTAPVAPVTPPSPPAPPAANPLYAMDANGLLVNARQFGSTRVDPVVGSDCPNTLTVGETGHVLSIARPDLGESFVGYAMRVSDQAHGDINTVGALFVGADYLFDKWGGFKKDGSNWPFAADRFYNLRAFMSPEEQAKDDAAKAGWVQWGQTVQNHQNNPPTPAPEPVDPPTPVDPLPGDEEPL